MTLVKICGITTLEDALVAIEAGADLLGFVFYPKSSRYVGIEVVKEIVSAIRDGRPETGDQKPERPSDDRSPISSLRSPHLIGLFVNETPARILEILAFAQLDYAQLHGDEPPEVLATLGNSGFKALRTKDMTTALTDATRFTTIRNSQFAIRNPQFAIRNSQFALRNSQSTIRNSQFAIRNPPPSLLIDTYDPNAYGGTGKRGDWAIAAAICRLYKRVLLAGGLTVENVAEAIAAVQPWGVDVSSGVEASPGRKDAEKVRAFVRAAKSVQQVL